MSSAIETGTPAASLLYRLWRGDRVIQVEADGEPQRVVWQAIDWMIERTSREAYIAVPADVDHQQDIFDLVQSSLPSRLTLGLCSSTRTMISCSVDRGLNNPYWWVDFGSSLPNLDPTTEAPVAELTIVDARFCPPELIDHLDSLQVIVIGEAVRFASETPDPLWGPMPPEVILAGA